MKCIFREITKDDFGLDGEIEVVSRKPDGSGYETTGGIIKVQAKSGESYVKQDTPEGFITPISKSDLENWYNAPYPVLFIVYHPRDDKLYYKEIKSYVLSTKAIFQAPLHIRFNKDLDQFCAESYRIIAQAARSSPPRVSLEQREQLFSNLLLVKYAPKKLWRAPTDYQSHAAVRSSAAGFLPPFLVADGFLYTLADLVDERCHLREYCDPTAIETVPAARWASDDRRRRDYVFLLNQLLGSHLWRCGLKYNREYKRNYFPRRNDTDKVFREDWYNVRTGRSAPPRIVAKFYEYGHARFWRHLSLKISFRRIASSWFLLLEPTYFYTEDGETPCSGDLVGPYTTGIKALERNLHVLNHVLFWCDILSQRRPAIDLSLYHKTIMSIEKQPFSGVASFAIPDDPALYEVDDAQLTFVHQEAEECTEGDDEY
ncbi:MAG: DUF4365 domain-containing protein [Terriglobales bacterium]|jgi:hypothetical protein